MTDVASAVRRARRLLQLSGSTHSAAEAATAAATAASILSKHGLTDLPEEDREITGNSDFGVHVSTTRRSAAPWKWRLGWAVATSAGCKPYYIEKKTGNRVTDVSIAFIGRREDAILCCAMLTHLIDECTRLRKSAMPTIGSLYSESTGMRTHHVGEVVDKAFQRRWSQSFYLALATKIHVSMRRSSDAVSEGSTETSKSLVATVSSDVDECAARMGIVYRSVATEKIRVNGAFNDGVGAAQNVSMEPSRRSERRALPPSSEDG